MAAKFLIEILGKSDQFAGEVRKVVNSLNTEMSQRVPGLLRSGLGRFFAVGAATGFARKMGEDASALKTLADRSGLTIEKLQELDYAARETNTSVNDFINAYRAMQVAQVAAARGNEEAALAFKVLGLNLEEVTKLSPAQLFDTLSRGIKNSALSSEQLNAVLKVFGRSADQLIPAWKTGLEELAEAARRAGQVIQTDVVNGLAEANDKWERTGRSVKAVVAPPLLKVAQGVDLISESSKVLWRNMQAGYYKFLGYDEAAKQALAERDRSWNEFLNRVAPQNVAPQVPVVPPLTVTPPAAGSAGAAASPELTGFGAGRGFTPFSDSFARLGLFVSSGGAQNQQNLVGLTRQTVRQLQNIDRRIGELPQKIADQL